MTKEHVEETLHGFQSINNMLNGEADAMVNEHSPKPLPQTSTVGTADSDDISTVVRFLNTMRPWTTLVGVSWGYGSNMLTKYLAEVGDSTPLTAAVCIDNPFDLNEATRSIPHRPSLDQELLSGLIDILQANKELFLGKGKGFDVQKALSAVTLRDFDEAISMVSHGYDFVEQFYANISTRQSIQNVKTPVLFIKSDNGTVPVFSIPRAEISENPFTSLLLSSYLTSGTMRSDQLAVMWCRQLAIEWLSAVELALLKGHHPLLEDIDISINPSKDFSFVKSIGVKKKLGRRYRGSSSLPLNKTRKNKTPLNGYLIGPPVEVDSTNGKVGKSLEKEVEGSKDVKEEVVEGEESQVLQMATVVMNMLDVTMPGTLNDAQKRKVLTAMERGETLMKALQEVVPDDVRGKLTTVATEIIQAQKLNLSLNVLKRVGWTKPTVPMTQDQQEIQPQISNLELEGCQRGTSDELPVSNDVNTPKYEVKRVNDPTVEQSAPAESHNPNSDETVLPQHEEMEGQVNETSKSRDVSTTPSNDVVEPNLQNRPSKIGEPLHVETEGQVNETSNSRDASTTQTNTVAEPNLQNSPSKIMEQLHLASQPPSINFNHALDALTGFDDSIQMAVTLVFGVFQNFIDQQKKKQETDESATDAKENKDAEGQNTEVRTEEPKNNVKMGQNEINHSSSSNKIEDDSQKEMRNRSIISSLESTSNQQKERDLSHDYLRQYSYEKLSSSQNLYWSMQYCVYFPQYVQKQLEAKEMDSDPATDLILDPQEGMWKLVNQAQISDIDSETSPRLDNVIEPSYVILETSTNETPNEEENIKFTATREQVALFIREELLGALVTEVRRKLGVLHLDFEEVDVTLVYDIEELATSVSQKVVQNSELNMELFSRRDIPKGKIGTIQGEYLTKTVSCAVHESNHLRRLLPVGLVVGCMLACLRKHFELSESHGDGAIKIKERYVPKYYDSKCLSGVQTKFEDEAQEKTGGLVSSLTEKAMSIAGPVVPTKSDGGVDLERLVAVLAELGQRGGILRVVGKLALLWGGIRGAMSLTDRLISFLHIGKRPLLHRLLGFVCMALLLWSPVVIPLLPTLVPFWAMKASTGIIGDACVIGLYAAVTILVIIWGKRIRGYEDPVVHYGLDVMSTTRVHEFLKGLAGGVMIVLSVHSVNSVLGYAHFSLGSLAVLKAYGNVLVLVVRGLLTATGVSLVEELLFRSWLQKEIAVDYGYYQAILLSGIAFSVIHRSVYSIPGFLLLSVALAGIKQRFMGKLAAPIGLRAGIRSTSYTLYAGGFITYKANTPLWLNSPHPLHPFNGAVGLGVCLMLAIIFFPHKRAKDDGDST
ncbi:uncharacterized protein LOC144552572 isoform X2 [Carex rostrata]